MKFQLKLVYEPSQSTLIAVFHRAAGSSGLSPSISITSSYQASSTSTTETSGRKTCQKQSQAASSVATKDSPDSLLVWVVVPVVSDIVLDSVSCGPEVVTEKAVRLATESVWFVTVAVWLATVDVVAIPVLVVWVTTVDVDVNLLVVWVTSVDVDVNLLVVVCVTADVDVEPGVTVSFSAVEFDIQPLLAVWFAIVDVDVDPAADLIRCEEAKLLTVHCQGCYTRHIWCQLPNLRTLRSDAGGTCAPGGRSGRLEDGLTCP